MPSPWGQRTGHTDDQVRKLHLEKLSWAVQLAQAPLKSFNAEQLLKIKKDLHRFLYGDQFLPGARDRVPVSDLFKHIDQYEIESFASKIPLGRLHEIQWALRQILNSFIQCRESGSLFTGARQVAFQFGWSAPGARFFWDVYVRDVIPAVKIALGAHLVGAQVTPDHVRRCAETDCGTIFLATRRPRADRHHFCSTACARRAARRQYRAKHTATIRLKDRTRSNSRYRARRLKRN